MRFEEWILFACHSHIFHFSFQTACLLACCASHRKRSVFIMSSLCLIRLACHYRDWSGQMGRNRNDKDVSQLYWPVFKKKSKNITYRYWGWTRYVGNVNHSSSWRLWWDGAEHNSIKQRDDLSKANRGSYMSYWRRLDCQGDSSRFFSSVFPWVSVVGWLRTCWTCLHVNLVWHTLNLLPVPDLLTHEVVTCTDCTNWSAQRGITSVNHVRAKEAVPLYWISRLVFPQCFGII